MKKVLFLSVFACFAGFAQNTEMDCSLLLRPHFLSFCDNGKKINKYDECLNMKYSDIAKYLKIKNKIPECEIVADIEFESFKIQQEITNEIQVANSYDCKKSKIDLSAIEVCVSYAKSLGEFRMRSLDNKYKIDSMCGKKIIGTSAAQNKIYDLGAQKNIIVIDPSLLMLTEDYETGLDKLYKKYKREAIKHCGDF